LEIELIMIGDDKAVDKNLFHRNEGEQDRIIHAKIFSFSFQNNDPFNRCSTPFVNKPSSPFNHSNMSPHSYPPHQRLPPNFPHATAAPNYWFSVSANSRDCDQQMQIRFSPNPAPTISALTSASSQLDDESIHEKSSWLLH
jgi:hypothetical protein